MALVALSLGNLDSEFYYLLHPMLPEDFDLCVVTFEVSFVYDPFNLDWLQKLPCLAT